MISRPLVSFDHLCLELVRPTEKGSGKDIELHLRDSVGTTIMIFRLPEKIANALKADKQEWQITMSPSGFLEVDGGEETPRRLVSMGLDELITQSLAPDMLEDEIRLKEQLAALRKRLEKALVFVDQTILSLPEQEG